MYAWLFRRLPGSVPLRVVQVCVIIALLLVLLFGWGFEWISDQWGLSEPTV